MTPIFGLINYQCENLGKQESAPDKQKLIVTCPTGKVKFRYFSSPVYMVKYGYGELCESMYGHVGLYMVIYAYEWLCRIMCGYLGLCIVMYGYVLLCMDMESYV